MARRARWAQGENARLWAVDCKVVSLWDVMVWHGMARQSLLTYFCPTVGIDRIGGEEKDSK